MKSARTWRTVWIAAFVCAVLASPGGAGAQSVVYPPSVNEPVWPRPEPMRPEPVRPPVHREPIHREPAYREPVYREYREPVRQPMPEYGAERPYGQPDDSLEPTVDPRFRHGDDERAAEHRGFSPQLQRLEEMLARYREIERAGGWRNVPTDLTMGAPYSYDCARIEMLEKRLVAEGYLRASAMTPPPPPPMPVDTRRGAKTPPPPPARKEMGQWGPCTYTRDVADAVRAFQVDRKIMGDGQVGPLTYRELNRPVHEIVDLLEHDVARWRHVSIDPAGTYLLVNIPFFELIAYDRGQEALRMKVVVGQKTWQTPLFSDQVEYIIVNPEWGIPESIAKTEIWPTAKRDKNYFKREGIVAVEGGLRQKPGPKNPLGRIKFMMPNQYDVYLHDTPGKGAFNAAVRALSHGCIRLSQPMDLAHYLLEGTEWTPERLKKAVSSGRTQQINLREPMPVHIVYSTTRVSDDGRLEVRPDVYSLNSKRLTQEASAHDNGDDSAAAYP